MHKCVQVARGRAIIPANKCHTELEPTIIGEMGGMWASLSFMVYYGDMGGMWASSSFRFDTIAHIVGGGYGKRHTELEPTIIGERDGWDVGFIIVYY